MLGSFAEYFSESLATHVRKGQSQRAIEGRHLGGIPFAYQSCWSRKDGQWNLQCDPEHPGGVHVVETEGTAVSEMFKRYASARNILHNRFYAGSVKHGKDHLPGVHEPVIGKELFEAVQIALAKNSGRAVTVGRRKTRTYLLKGLPKCAPCGMNLWAQTYRNGHSYYRVRRASRSNGVC